MVEKINDRKDLQNVSGGFKITKEKKGYKLQGIMKIDGKDTNHLHRNVAKGFKCTTHFKTMKEARAWGEKFMY